MQTESFVQFLEDYGNAHRPSLTDWEKDDFGVWQSSFRAALAGLRGPVPDRVELQVHVEEVVQEQTHRRHLLRIPVSEFSCESDVPRTFLSACLPATCVARGKM